MIKLIIPVAVVLNVLAIQTTAQPSKPNNVASSAVTHVPAGNDQRATQIAGMKQQNICY